LKVSRRREEQQTRRSLQSRSEEIGLGLGHHDVVVQVLTGVAVMEGGMIGEAEMGMHAELIWMSGR
jgi:hypothetical protein